MRKDTIYCYIIFILILIIINLVSALLSAENRVDFCLENLQRLSNLIK